MKRTMEWLALAAILVCAGPAQAASCPDRGTVMAYTLGTIMAYTPDRQGYVQGRVDETGTAFNTAPMTLLVFQNTAEMPVYFVMVIRDAAGNIVMEGGADMEPGYTFLSFDTIFAGGCWPPP